MSLTGRVGALAAVAALLVLVAPRPGTAVLAALLVLVVLVAVDLWLAGEVRGLRLERDGDRLVRLGEYARVGLVIENPGRRRVRGLVRDAWPPSAGPRDGRHRLDLPPGERRRLLTTLRPTRRGDRHSVSVTVRSVGPLGLAARQGTHRVPWMVRVLPPFLSRRHLPEKLARLRELEGRHPSLLRGHGTEFDSLREYVIGDDVRAIDWRATARRRDVVVRTWRPERDRRILLVLDTGRTSAGRVGISPIPPATAGWPRLDWSIDAALLLTAMAGKAGDRVDLLAYDRTPRAWASGRSGGRLLSTVVNALAPLEPELLESDPDGLVATILARAGRRCLVVLLTDLHAAAMNEGLLTLLPQVATRHLLVVAAVSDPRVAAMAAGRGTAERVYDAAAAERLRGERRRITARLAGHGIEVVDALPDELAPALADSYLALKAAGRL